MRSGVEKVDSVAGGSQHRGAARPRQLRALLSFLLVAACAAAPLAAQQERVVRGLSFEGNHAIDDYTLGSAIATSSSSVFASLWFLRWMRLGERRYFNELEFRRDVVRLLLLYRQSGYMNAVVDTVVRREGGDVHVLFRIYEGEPVRLTKLTLVGLDSILDVAGVKRTLPLQEGAPFNRLLFQASADTIADRLRNAGYPYADVLRNYDVDAADLKAEASLEALPGPRARIDRVVITGLEQVDTGTVRKMLSVHPRDLFRQDRLYQSQRDLYGMGVFRSVNIVLADSAPRAGDSTVTVLVRVAEGPRHRVRVGAGYGSLDCFRVQSGWTAYDFFGGARALDLTARVSKLGVGVPTNAGLRSNVCHFLHDDFTSDTVNYNVGLTLRQPAFFSPRHTASLGLFAERRSEFNAYTRQAIGRRGVLAWRALAGTIVSARRIALAGQSVHFIPPDQRFYGGGPNSVRGYARNELGPRVYVTDDTTGGVYQHVTASPIGGNSIVVMNAEVRLPTPLFPDRMRLALFVDAGQVWERGGDPGTVAGVRVTPGIGLRLATPLGPVRLDAAYNGYPAEPGPLYFQDNTTQSLTLVPNVVYQPGLAPGFWQRVVVQFAVGQAF